MNTPNPLMPQGSLQQNQSRGKSTVRLAVLTIVAIHALFFAGLLMQGCDRKGKTPSLTSTTSTNVTNELPKADREYYSNIAEVPTTATNLPVTNVVLSPTNRMTLPVAVAPPPKTPEARDYTVAKGDTLAKIAKAQGVTLAELTKANPDAEPTRLKIGQKLLIPPPAAPAPVGPGFVEPGPGETGKVHVVKSGETLTVIAKRHGVTIPALKAANNLKTDRLHVGDKLKLPAPKAPAAGAASGTTTPSSLLSTTNAFLTPLPARSFPTNR